MYKQIGLLCFLFLFIKEINAQEKGFKKIGVNNNSVSIKTKSDSTQYALGAYVAKWMNEKGLSVISPAIFNAGLADYLNDVKNKKLNDQIITNLVSDWQQVNQKERGVKQEQRLFNSLKDKPNIGMLPNGVRYMILKKGTGRLPIETDTLQLHIYARLVDSTVLENTYQNKQAVLNAPGNFFPGLKESLLMMSAGSKWQLFIPSNQAFGEKGNLPRIPPNSPLIIDVEIVAFNKNN